MSAFTMNKFLSLLLLLTGAAIVAAVEEEVTPPRILDLSEPFEVGCTCTNEGALEIEQFLTRDVRRFIVIEDGIIVKDYSRDTVQDEFVYNLWSGTKAVISMIIGTIIMSDEYDLSIDDTLGDIFAGDNDWTSIEDPVELAFKQNITIYELLTMTSGLTQDFSLDVMLNLQNPLQPFDIPNSAGINLRQSLKYHTWNTTMKGEFSYVLTSNILSYVIVAVTGMTPKEYVAVDIFPSLGIDVNAIQWDENFSGVQTALSSLHMTARDMAKVAQLYLQRGQSAPGKQLVSEEFVSESLSRHAQHYNGPWGLLDYGYMWLYKEFNTTQFPNQIGAGMWCGMGIFGQNFCFNYESNRVVVYQRSNTFYDDINEFLLADVFQTAFSANFTWNKTVIVEESSGFSLSASTILVMAPLVSCLAFLL